MNDTLFTVLPPLLRDAHLMQYLPGEQYTLPIRSLTINPHTVSKTCDQAIVEALAVWFNDGAAYPTVVFTVHDDKPTVVAGEYALRATEWLGYDYVFGYHVTGSLRALAYIENFFREDLEQITMSAEFSELPEMVQQQTYSYFARLLQMDFSDVDTMRQVSSLPAHIKARFRIGSPLIDALPATVLSAQA